MLNHSLYDHTWSYVIILLITSIGNVTIQIWFTQEYVDYILLASSSYWVLWWEADAWHPISWRIGTLCIISNLIISHLIWIFWLLIRHLEHSIHKGCSNSFQSWHTVIQVRLIDTSIWSYLVCLLCSIWHLICDLGHFSHLRASCLEFVTTCITGSSLLSWLEYRSFSSSNSLWHLSFGEWLHVRNKSRDEGRSSITRPRTQTRSFRSQFENMTRRAIRHIGIHEWIVL